MLIFSVCKSLKRDTGEEHVITAAMDQTDHGLRICLFDHAKVAVSRHNVAFGESKAILKGCASVRTDLDLHISALCWVGYSCQKEKILIVFFST